MAEYDILTIADLNVDLVLMDAVPEFGQKEKIIPGYLLELGGSCPIFACQAAKLNLQTAVVGVLGDDLFGHFILERLRECGVDVKFIEIRSGLKTAASFALCYENDRAILTEVSGIIAMPPERITPSLLSMAKHLHVGSYFLLSNLKPHFLQIIALAKSLGLTVSLDTNWDPKEKWQGVDKILKMIDVLFPSEKELLALTRVSNLEEALDIVAKIVPIVVVKRGSLGAIARAGDKTWNVPAFKVDYLDAVGAGDSFDAGFLKGYLNGWSIEASLQLGSYCGAMNTTAFGGIKGQPYWSELPLKFIRDNS